MLQIGIQAKAMFNKTKEVQGTIYDMSSNTVWIENAEDMYPCPIDTATEVQTVEVSPIDARVNELVKYIKYESGETASVTDNSDFQDVAFETEKYIVSIGVYADRYEVDTQHKNRNKWQYVGNANNRTIKRWETLTKQIIKYIEA